MVGFLFFNLLFLILAVLIFFLNAIFWLITGVPSTGSRKIIVQWLNQELKGKEKKIFYDLGSGDGYFLYLLAKENPQIEFFGFEINPVLYLFAKIFHRQPNLHFYNKNFFKINLKEANYLYLYLGSEIIEKLYPKLKKELSVGTVVISNSFPLPNLQPQKFLSTGKILETLYFYQF